jgi:hypothetical protein
MEPFSNAVCQAAKRWPGRLCAGQAEAMSLGPIAHTLIGGKPDANPVPAPHSTRKASTRRSLRASNLVVLVERSR